MAQHAPSEWETIRVEAIPAWRYYRALWEPAEP
jgi:hypothetical protein